MTSERDPAPTAIRSPLARSNGTKPDSDSRSPDPEPRIPAPIASTIPGTSPVPSTASISGICARNSSRYRSARQPVTISFRHLPSFLCSAISRIVSTDSCLALSMKAQVLTTSTSASAASRVSSCPACWASPSITSESTRFLGQPSEIIPIFIQSLETGHGDTEARRRSKPGKS